MGKKTLYLDLDAVDSLNASLQRLPGRPSLSSFLNEQLPVLASTMERMVSEAEKSGLRGAASIFRSTGVLLEEFDAELQAITSDPDPALDKPLPLSRPEVSIPPKKRKSSKPKK